MMTTVVMNSRAKADNTNAVRGHSKVSFRQYIAMDDAIVMKEAGACNEVVEVVGIKVPIRARPILQYECSNLLP
jgi:hypothetical protein